MIKDSCIRDKNTGSFWKLFPGSLVFVALIFTTFSSAFASTATDQFIDLSTGGDEISTLLFDAGDHLDQNPFNPDLPDPIPEEPEEESDEKKDNPDDDYKAHHRVYYPHLTSLANVWLGQTSQSFQHRKTIPFFILFHSWKSFLA